MQRELLAYSGSSAKGYDHTHYPTTKTRVHNLLIGTIIISGENNLFEFLPFVERVVDFVITDSLAKMGRIMEITIINLTINFCDDIL